MKRAITIILTLIVIAAGAIWYVPRLRAAGAEEKTTFKIAKSEKGMVKKTVSATGTLQPWRVIDIKSKAGGRVDHMAGDVGSVVKPGQVI
jgi:HlyD family secretion protein